MKTERLPRIKEIFSAALDVPPEEREQQVRQMSGGDTELEREVADLLALHAETGLEMDRGAAERRPGDVLAGRYRVDKLIGSGGMGEVYRAIDLADACRPVAIKTIRPLLGANEYAEQRFLREVRMAQKIDHPNVCRTLALVEHDGQRFCVMELLEGETLAERLRSGGRMSVEEARPIVSDLCAGLAAAHAAGVVHRDLKPGNIVLAEAGRAVIIDFGLAAGVAHDQSLTADGEVIGTLAYMAPEQLAEGKASPASDLYALGVVMAEMLTGQKPHGAASPLRMAARKASQPQLARQLAEVPWTWREVIERCLRTSPEQRYAGARQVEEALRRGRPSVRFLLSRPTVALPVGAAAAGLIALAAWQWLNADYRPAHDTRLLYEQAQAAMIEAAPVRAVRLLEQALTRDPSFLAARALAAAGYAELDQPERAREAVLEAAGTADRRWSLGRGERIALRAARAVVVSDHKQAALLYEQLAAASTGPTRTFAQLASARAIERSGNPDGALRAVEAVVRAAPDNPAARLRFGILLSSTRQPDRALREFQTAEKIFERSANREGLCDLLLARASARLGDPEADRRDLEHVLALSEKTGNRYHSLTAKSRMAVVAEARLDYDEAVRLSREAADQARREGMPIVGAQALGELGYAFLFKKRPAQAEPILREAVELAERAKATGVLASNRMRLGEVLGALQRPAEAVELMEPAVAWLRQSGHRDALPLMLIKWGTVLSATPRFAQSEAAYREALELATAGGHEMYQSMAVERLGAYLTPRDPAKAAEYWDRAVKLARKTRLIRVFALAARNAAALGRFAQADELIAEGEAETGKHPPGVDRNNFEALFLSTKALVAHNRGECAAADSFGSSAAKLAPALAQEMRMWNCASSPASVRPVLEWHEREDSAARWPSYHQATFGPRLAAMYLRNGNAPAARVAAVRGLAAARQSELHLYTFENTIALRAAERKLGNTVEAEKLTSQAVALASRFSLGTAGNFNGRQDLVELWRAGSGS